jgi:hypothetical protein
MPLLIRGSASSERVFYLSQGSQSSQRLFDLNSLESLDLEALERVNSDQFSSPLTRGLNIVLAIQLDLYQTIGPVWD